MYLIEMTIWITLEDYVPRTNDFMIGLLRSEPVALNNLARYS